MKYVYCLWFQVALAGTQIWWTTEVNLSFARLEEGYENALKDYYKKQVPNPISEVVILDTVDVNMI